LLTESQRERLDVVLVSPRNPLNIGAAARAMANFGFSRLAVVAPYEPHWREAKSAIGAEELLHSARKTEALPEAVADSTLVAGTGTLSRRKPEQPVVPLPAFTSIVESELTRGGRVALVFGPEKHGLTREDLSFCNILVEIPTDPRQPSMNLGQAVAVCLYELSTRSALRAEELGAPGPGSSRTDLSPMVGGPSLSGIREATPRIGDPATARELDLLAEMVDKAMTAANYSPRAMRSANLRDLHLMVRRLALTRHDAKRILVLFRRILRRLEQLAGSPQK
jgi:TrmH family RNA methyltransferase